VSISFYNVGKKAEYRRHHDWNTNVFESTRLSLGIDGWPRCNTMPTKW